VKIIFEKFFEIRLKNNFYMKHDAEDFKIEPASICSSLQNNYRLVSRQTGSGILVFIELEDPLSGTPLVQPDKKAKLSYVIFSVNSFLKNFTELALDPKPQSIYHFSNLNNNVQNSDLLLSAGTSDEFVSNDDLVVLKPSRFYYNETFTGSSAHVQLTDFENNVIIDQIASILNNELSFFIDVSIYQPGRFSLYVDGSLKLDFYSDDSLTGKSIFGIIDIYFSDLVPAAYRPLDLSGKVSEKTYSVKFKKRKSTWKYFVVLKFKSTINPADLLLIYPDSTNSFTRQSPVTLSDGYVAVPFISDNEIDFSDSAIKGIQLKKQNGTGIFEIDNLPNASYKNIKPDLVNNKVFSEIFIYV
jgi:hypothetical protein